ncbi:hypothetical protein MHBO_002237 [Bonamia ostreae]|uniref:Uncharacterized protein n=1 Tax=Bonamia ostreae TaxID=126728 RepID=A0ABV2ALM8_9EUKA
MDEYTESELQNIFSEASHYLEVPNHYEDNESVILDNENDDTRFLKKNRDKINEINEVFEEYNQKYWTIEDPKSQEFTGTGSSTTRYQLNNGEMDILQAHSQFEFVPDPNGFQNVNVSGQYNYESLYQEIDNSISGDHEIELSIDNSINVLLYN